MKIDRIENMKGGWFIGDFEPSVYKTKDFEVSYKVHYKGEKWDFHYHTEVTEINYLVKGQLIIQNTILNAGDIFTLEPYEISDPEFVTDCELVVVKTPSANDKVNFQIK
jgi:quercetin dioxygenase-like cupin family protein